MMLVSFTSFGLIYLSTAPRPTGLASTTSSVRKLGLKWLNPLLFNALFILSNACWCRFVHVHLLFSLALNVSTIVAISSIKIEEKFAELSRPRTSLADCGGFASLSAFILSSVGATPCPENSIPKTHFFSLTVPRAVLVYDGVFHRALVALLP